MERIYNKKGKYPKVDYVGKTFGRLTVIRWEGRADWGGNKWLCKCICDNKTVVWQEDLKRCLTKSCGCLQKEVVTKHGYCSGIEGKHPLYITLNNMKDRCYNKNFKQYKDYGGRGIKVCDEWLNSPKAFIEWAMDNGYEEGLTIERINNDGDYCPENCCFITLSEQGNNKRSNHLITYKGKTQNIAQWAKEVGLHNGVLLYRANKGWPIEDVLFTPLNSRMK